MAAIKSAFRRLVLSFTGLLKHVCGIRSKILGVIQLKLGKIINAMHVKAQPYASPHYYHGRSSIRLFVNNLLLTVFRFILVKPPSKKVIAPIRELRNSRNGKTALVLGNGPSIDSINAEILKKYVDDVYCVNEFYDLHMASAVKCNNYVLSDPMSFGTKDFALPERLIELLKSNDADLFLPHWSENAFRELKQERPIYFLMTGKVLVQPENITCQTSQLHICNSLQGTLDCLLPRVFNNLCSWT